MWAFFDDRLAFVESCARSGDSVFVRFGPRRALVLSHPELVREVFVHEAKHFIRGITGKPMRSLLGEGLLLSEGEVWRRQRREVQPMFASDGVARWTPSIEAATDALVARWRDGERRDIHHEMHRLTLDIAARLFLGVESDERDRLHPALEATLGEDLFGNAIPLGAFRWPMRQAGKATELERLVEERIADAERGRVAPFIARLAESAKDRREVRDQIMTLIFTSQDTTAVALTWLWHLVSRDERAECVLRDEAMRSQTTPQTRPYLTAVFNETMRLFPPVVGQAREAARACEIGNASVRPGDLVMFSQWVIHRDPRWFDKPESFMPERWEDGFEDRLHPFAYFPFGGGRRVCVGRTLALAIAATVVPSILRRYRLVATSERRPDLHTVVTPRPKGGLPMELRRLD